MKNLAFAVYLLSGICAIHASSTPSLSPEDMNVVVKLYEDAGIRNFVRSFGHDGPFLDGLATLNNPEQAAYAKAVANDALILEIAGAKDPEDKDAVIRYIRSEMTRYISSEMTQYTVAEPHNRFPQAIEAITGHRAITCLTFGYYLTSSDMPAVISAAATMPALTELRLIYIKRTPDEEDLNNSLVRAIARAREEGNLLGLTTLVLPHLRFKPEELGRISAIILPGVNVRLSTADDFRRS